MKCQGKAEREKAKKTRENYITKSLLIRTVYLILFFFSIWLYSPLLGLVCFFSFLILYTISRTPWTGDQLVTRPLPTHRTTQTQNKSTQISITRVGFEPTTPMFERAKTINTL
jgi:ABC-type polysaccharide transport system permease subunit